mmetsp:Transcript_82929/g.165537  ORF Transcript_82929/g.165537 Transcript_82929/m.165537 type:complete len:247 (+) Transcript_82929:821-1561(+)
MALQLPYLFHGPGALRIVRVEPQRFLQMLLGLIEVRAVEESHRAQDVCLGHVGVALDHLAGGAERSITKTEPQFGSHQPEARDGSVRLGEHVGEEGASEGVISMVDGSLTLLLPGRKLRNLGLFLDHLRVTRLPRTRVGSHHGLLKLAKLAESACEALVGLRTPVGSDHTEHGASSSREALWVQTQWRCTSDRASARLGSRPHNHYCVRSYSTPRLDCNNRWARRHTSGSPSCTARSRLGRCVVQI